jgi:hypothetical protein
MACSLHLSPFVSEEFFVFGNALNASVDSLCEKPFYVMVANSCAVNNTFGMNVFTHLLLS